MNSGDQVNGFQQFFSNRYLSAAFIAAFLAQFSKVLVNYLLERRWNWKLMNRSGGMPSSHTAAMMAITVIAGRLMGLDSAAFAIAATMTTIVMYDASGVRRAAGDQAKILNYIILQVPDLQELQIKQLKEIIGHTPIEVLAGAILGLAVGFAM